MRKVVCEKKGTSGSTKSSNSGDLVSELVLLIVITSIYVKSHSVWSKARRLARDGQITKRGTGRTRGKVEEDTEHESSIGFNDDGRCEQGDVTIWWTTNATKPSFDHEAPASACGKSPRLRGVCFSSDCSRGFSKLQILGCS
jgi:hypothetical protein